MLIAYILPPDMLLEMYYLFYELDIGRSVYHFLQYIYSPTRYTM